MGNLIGTAGFVITKKCSRQRIKNIETIRDKEYAESSVLLFYIWRKCMNFVPSSVKAEEWGISQRRVAILCKEGHVPGAELIGNRWFLPVDAMKPEDPRKARKNEQ